MHLRPILAALLVSLLLTVPALPCGLMDETEAWRACPQPNGYSLRKEYSGWFSLVQNDRVVWSAYQPEQWNWAVPSGDGRWALTSVERRLYLWDVRGKLRGEICLPTNCSADGQLTRPLAWYDSANSCFYLEAAHTHLLKVEVANGALTTVTNAELPKVLTTPSAEPLVAVRLATAHNFKLPRATLLRAEQRCSWEGNAYRARHGNGELPAWSEWAPVSPKMTASAIIAHPLSTPRLTAQLCSAAQLAQLRRLLGPSDPQLRAAMLLAYRGDRRGLELILQGLTQSPPSPELVLGVLELEDPSIQVALIRCLGFCGPKAAPFKRQLCDYFCAHPCLAAVQGLLTTLQHAGEEMHWSAAKALSRCARAELGDNPSAWESWLRRPAWDKPRERVSYLAMLGEPSALLWLGRHQEKAEQIRSGLLRHSRCVAVLPTGATTKLRFGPRLELWRQQGQVNDGTISWNLASGKPLQKLQGRGERDRFAWSDRRDLLLVVDPIKHRLAVGQDKGSLTWAIEEGAYAAEVTGDGSALLIKWPFSHAVKNVLCPLLKGNITPNHRIVGDCLLSEGTGISIAVEGGNRASVWRSPWKKSIQGPPGSPLAVSPDSSRVALRQRDKRLAIWDWSLNKTRCYSLVTDDPMGGIFSPDGQRLALHSFEGITVLALEGGGMQSASIPHVQNCIWSPDGQRLAVVSTLGLQIYSVPSLQCQETFPTPHLPQALAYSPDGRYLAAACGAEIRVWDLHPQWDDLQGQDLQLLSELWTGQKLSGGAATVLSAEAYAWRKKQWEQQTGTPWFVGWPGLQKPVALLWWMLAVPAGGLFLKRFIINRKT